MDLKNFIREVKEFTQERLGSDFDVRLHEVMKNNNVKLHGISIIKKGDCIGPNIYLDGYFERYLQGMSVEEIFEEIKETYEQTKVSQGMAAIHKHICFDDQKDKVIFRLISYEKNIEMLKNMPYIRFLDMAITFHCLVNKDEEGISTLPITNVIMEHWNANESILLKLAMNNTERLLKMRIRRIEEVIMELFESNMERIFKGKEVSKENSDYFEQMRVTFEQMQQEEDVEMYVVTNDIGINGATVLLYQESFKEFVRKIGCDVYILPSSIHELIIIPVLENVSPKHFMETVKEVNITQLPYEDVLSDHVYRFYLESEAFEII